MANSSLSLRQSLTAVSPTVNAMTVVAPAGTGALNTVEDLSGVLENLTGDNGGQGGGNINPYNKLLEAAKGDPSVIARAYETHRLARNQQQREKLLAPTFSGMAVDHTLCELERAKVGWGVRELGEIDPRRCLVIWVRPTREVREIVKVVQDRLGEAAPDLWLTPPENLHMTALEISDPQSSPALSANLTRLRPVLPSIVRIPRTHRISLTRPLLSFDAAGLAISFIPTSDSAYTYHHFRQEIFDKVASTGVRVTSRYYVPTAHVTIARFVTERNRGGEGVQEWLERIDDINRWLSGLEVKWVVGEEEEAAVECRVGRVWYGDGERVATSEYRSHGPLLRLSLARAGSWLRRFWDSCI